MLPGGQDHEIKLGKAFGDLSGFANGLLMAI